MNQRNTLRKQVFAEMNALMVKHGFTQVRNTIVRKYNESMFHLLNIDVTNDYIEIWLICAHTSMRVDFSNPAGCFATQLSRISQNDYGRPGIPLQIPKGVDFYKPLSDYERAQIRKESIDGMINEAKRLMVEDGLPLLAQCKSAQSLFDASQQKCLNIGLLLFLKKYDFVCSHLPSKISTFERLISSETEILKNLKNLKHYDDLKRSIAQNEDVLAYYYRVNNSIRNCDELELRNIIAENESFTLDSAKRFFDIS